MALTSLKVYLEPPADEGSELPRDGIIEYCRNERGREKIKLRVIPTPNDATINGDSITVQLFKTKSRGNLEVVQAKQNITFTGAVPTEGYLVEINAR